MENKFKYPILYSFRRCPYAMRARLAIKTSGIKVELREIKLQNKPKAFLNISPKATVPLLHLSKGKILDESLDIMEWALKINDPLNWLSTTELDNIRTFKLLNQLEKEFKMNLDKYKYSSRFEDKNPKFYRDKNLVYLTNINNLLQRTKCINSDKLSLADYAIYPFIRQYRNVDKKWFDSLEFDFLKSWLNDLIDSDYFLSIMKKFEVWDPINNPIYTNFEQ